MSVRSEKNMLKYACIVIFAGIGMSTAYAPCMTSQTVNCLICTKGVLTSWFMCCCTDSAGCNQLECRQVECYTMLGGMKANCPISGFPNPVSDPDIEKRFLSVNPGKTCTDPPGTCN